MWAINFDQFRKNKNKTGNKQGDNERMEDDYDEVVGNAGLPQLHKFSIMRKVST